MKKLVLLFVLSAFSLICFSQDKIKIKGDKIVTTSSDSIPTAFNAIELAEKLDLNISQSLSNSYSITADSNLHEFIKFEVVDSTLKIYTAVKIVRSKKLELSLNFAKLNKIIIKNGGEIVSDNTLVTDKMELIALNSSKFDLDIKTERLDITLQDHVHGKLLAKTTNSKIFMRNRSVLDTDIYASNSSVALTEYALLKLSGDTNMATYDIRDRSELKAEDMKTSVLELNSKDFSKGYVYVSQKLKLDERDNSFIYLFGQPSIEIKSFTDRAELIKR